MDPSAVLALYDALSSEHLPEFRKVLKPSEDFAYLSLREPVARFKAHTLEHLVGMVVMMLVFAVLMLMMMLAFVVIVVMSVMVVMVFVIMLVFAMIVMVLVLIVIIIVFMARFLFTRELCELCRYAAFLFHRFEYLFARKLIPFGRHYFGIPVMPAQQFDGLIELFLQKPRNMA